jgi:hypothetical protein
MDMALTISGEQVEAVLRKLLPRQSYVLRNPPRKKGETGADILAEKNGRLTAVECIGFQQNPPLRSKQFYEAFFRAISRLEQGVQECVMALPARFADGMNQRARHYGVAWKRIAEAFPELRIWLVSIDKCSYEVHTWADWPTRTKAPKRRQWAPKEDTIGHVVLQALSQNPEVSYEVLRDLVLTHAPHSKFNKSHLAWYKSQFRKRR